MKKYFSSSIGRFRVLAFLEGVSLLVLVFIGVPMKYFMDMPSVVKSIGPIHGGLFVFYVIYALNIGSDYDWKLIGNTGKVLIASFIPFGTFYTDHTILKPLDNSVDAKEDSN